MEKDVKSDQGLWDKAFSFGQDMAEVKADMKHLTELSQKREADFDRRVAEISESVKDAIQTSFAPMSERIVDVTKMVRKHEDILEKITRLQENQAIQLESMQETLKETRSHETKLAKLEEKMSSLEERRKADADSYEKKIRELESKQKTEAQIHMEKVKARWTFAGIVATGILSIIGIILGAIV